MTSQDIAQIVSEHLLDVPDFPEEGVLFKDVTPLIAHAEAFNAVIGDMADRHRGEVDVVAGIEARGFIFGAAVAHELGLGFVPVRKAGKLPGQTAKVSYQLEYGSATIEIKADGIPVGSRVLLIDDVLATGGTAAAAFDLIEQVGAQVAGFDVVIELLSLSGRDRLRTAGREVHAQLSV
ncbi:adenine phosphoribosyltransferase [Kribbia dieselivorans]|uniref:adenine phosphoribosyltransferase n=1 Tax=Kribbia dieselivorans TaxID=331526 RepID=UPI0008380990|nr:adenine phosphoribosyltransferase [Kribbia dieselivorans]